MNPSLDEFDRFRDFELLWVLWICNKTYRIHKTRSDMMWIKKDNGI